MCQYCLVAPVRHEVLPRRGFLKLAAGAAAGVAIAPRAFAAKVKAPPKPQNVLSSDAALDRLMKGNARYVQGVSTTSHMSVKL